MLGTTFRGNDTVAYYDDAQIALNLVAGNGYSVIYQYRNWLLYEAVLKTAKLDAPVVTGTRTTALKQPAYALILAGLFSCCGVKNFLLDQRRLAGIGNIYASEILHRAGVEPRRRAGALSREEWEAVAAGTTRVLREAIGRMGTTFSTYRTLWNEPGGYGERLRVYDRAGEPCRRCRTPIRRIVQGQRSTFYCPACQPRRGGGSGDGGRSRRRPGGGPVRRQGAGSRAGPRTSAASRETRNPSPAGRNRAGTSS